MNDEDHRVRAEQPRTWVHADPWLAVGGSLAFLLVLGWLRDPPGTGGPAVVKQLMLSVLFVYLPIVGSAALAGFAGRGVLADLARWMVVVMVGVWVLGIGAALTFATGDPQCATNGARACTTSAMARLTGTLPIAVVWFASRELAHNIAKRRYGHRR